MKALVASLLMVLLLAVRLNADEPAAKPAEEPKVIPALRLKPALKVKPAGKADAPATDEAKPSEEEKAKAREEALKKRQEQQARILKQLEEQRAKEKAEAEAAQAKYPYQSTKFIPVNNETSNAKLFSFCLGPDQKLYTLVVSSNNGAYEIEIVDGVQKVVKPKQTAAQTQEVVVLDLEGKELLRWEVSFRPERIVAAADGTVYVGGSGKLAKFSAQGKLLHESELPHIAAELKDEKLVKESALEEHNEQLEMYKEQVKQYQAAVKAKAAAEEAKKNKNAEDAPAKPAKDKPEADSDEEVFSYEEHLAQMPSKQLEQMLANFEQQLKTNTEKSEADIIEDFKKGLLNKNSIHALTLSGENLIYTTRQLRGYGYAVWKVDAQLENPTKLMQGLGGCCGQCDVQCYDGKLYVADNTKHRVSVFDLNGKKLSHAGTKGRDGDGDTFGGCCNPMNVAFSSTGQILTAESEGYVKCFSPDGQFQALLGRSLLASGCKHVALNMTQDGKYVIFLDQPGSRLVRLEKVAEPKLLENKTTAVDEAKVKASE